jgi:hypothetical protein
MKSQNQIIAEQQLKARIHEAKYIRATTQQKRFKMIIVDGRRWFQRSYGNTYHSVVVTVDGVTVKSGQHYGYGDHYRQTAFNMLQELGYFKGYNYNTFCQWCYTEKNRNKIHFTCADVSRERDL